MKLSQYVKIINSDNINTKILCHTLNRTIITLDEKYFINDNSINEELLSKIELEYLIKKNFFSNNVQKYLDATVNLKRKYTTITINVTEHCNLKCPYCYQNNFENEGTLTSKSINIIIDYIESVMRNGEQNFYIYFFGGEPLLYKNKILEIKSKIEQIPKINVIFGIGTNSYLLTPEFLNEFNHIIIDTVLTLKEDQDIMRPTKGGNGTYDKIINNLREASKLKNITLNIGYNTHNGNLYDFENFLKLLNQEQIKANIECYYLDNYDFNLNFNNTLNYDDFLKWKSSIAIRLLIKYGFSIKGSPFVPYNFECDGYNEWSIKLFSDTSLGICNATHYNKRIKWNSALKHENIAKHLQQKISNFKENKSKFNSQCQNCSLIGLCKGKIYCHDELCKPMDSYDFDTFINEYIYQTKIGNAKFFTSI